MIHIFLYLSFLIYPSLPPQSHLSGNALLSPCVFRMGAEASDTTRLRSLLGISASVKPALLLTSAGRTCSTRFTRLLSHASAFRRGKPSSAEKPSAPVGRIRNMPAASSSCTPMPCARPFVYYIPFKNKHSTHVFFRRTHGKSTDAPCRRTSDRSDC